jgi:hypothetical protein
VLENSLGAITTVLAQPKKLEHHDCVAMPRPFPYPITIGTDICSVQRIFNILKAQNSSGANAFLRRILIEQEREQFQARSYAGTLQLWHKLQRQKLQLDKRREYLGIPKGWREQLALMARDNPPTDQSATNTPKLNREARFNMSTNSQTPLESLAHKVNNVEILRQLEDEIEKEDGTMQTQLQKVAQFLAGRQVQRPSASFLHTLT